MGDNSKGIPDAIHYLPEIYHDQTVRRGSPLAALLTVIEETFGSIEAFIDNLDRYFDIMRAPDGSGKTPDGKRYEEDFLPWLASWLELPLDHRWSSEKRRYVLKAAAYFYEFQGTKAGLRYLLQIYFGIRVEIIEWQWPIGMRVGVRNTIGVDTRLHENPDRNYCFVVKWNAPVMEDEELREMVQAIRRFIDRVRPVHTKCFFIVSRPRGVPKARRLEERKSKKKQVVLRHFGSGFRDSGFFKKHRR